MFGRLFDGIVRFLLHRICVIDDHELKEKMPMEGPLLLIFNHISFIEAPLFYLYMQPRKIFGIMKAEIARVPVIGAIARRWGGITIERGAPPSATFRRAGELMQEGAIIGISPEGTRSGSGVLGMGNPGVVSLALRTDAPIIPVVHYGTHLMWRNLRRFKRTSIVFRVGRPFKLLKPEANTKEDRRELTRVMMLQLAALLPEELRGEYREAPADNEERILFL